ncbi:MAG: trigger factor [Desulfococcaceae bacterium]
MQVSVENLSTVKKVLHIEIPEEDVSREIDKAYDELRKTASVKGFRPGKATRAVLERLYRKDVNADVCSRLIQESFGNAIREKQLNIVGQPDISTPEIRYRETYRYDAKVEVAPELEDIDFKGLKLKKNLYRVGDHEVEGQLQMLRRNLVQHKPIAETRPVREGDFVLMDYEGFRNGSPFEGIQKTENYTMKIGSGQIAKEIDENLIGMNPGEKKEIAVNFPQDHAKKDLAGQNIIFHVALKEIREEYVPEIDDALAKNFGKYETLEQLKEAVVKNLEEGYSKRSEQEIREQVFSSLIGRRDFEVPDALVEYELQSIIAEAEQSFSYHNIKMEDIGITRESLAEKYRPLAVKQVKRHLILGKIIAQEKLSVSEEETDKAVEEMAETFQQPAEEVKKYYRENPDKLEYFRHTLLEKKAIRLIIDSSETEEVIADRSAESGSEEKMEDRQE